MTLAWQPIDTNGALDEAEYRGDPADLVEALGDLVELLEPPRWHAEALCRGLGLDLWFPGRGDDIRTAQAICAACPVAAECAEAAKLDGYFCYGIWAGSSHRRRQRPH